MAKKKQSHAARNIGVGLTAAAVTAAGAYFLYGSKNAPKNRKMVKSWVLKAKAEVLEQLEKAEHMTEAEYAKLIDSVAAMYGRMRGVSKSELVTFKKEMKGHWKRIRQNGSARKVKQTAKKRSAKKTTKKSSKKRSKKGR